MEMLNLKNFSEVGGKEKYYVKVSIRFAALGDLDFEVEFKVAWETITHNEEWCLLGCYGCYVVLVRTDVSEEPGASFIRVTKIGELGTT
jgi:hypothetical protein